MRSGSVPARLTRQQGQGVAYFAAGVRPSPTSCAGSQLADATHRSQVIFAAGSLRSASASVTASSAPNIASVPVKQRATTPTLCSAAPGSFSWLPQQSAGQVPLARSAPRASSRGPNQAGRSCARLASPYPVSASLTIGPTQGPLESSRFVSSRPAAVSGASSAPNSRATTPTRRACQNIVGPPSEGATAELARLHTMLALARHVLASWTTPETRRVIQEAFESIDRSRLQEAVWSSDDVRRFGHRILKAQGIEPSAWPDHAWRSIYQSSSPDGQGYPLRDLGMAERLAFAILERRSKEIEHRAAELEPSLSNVSIQASSATVNSASPRSARLNQFRAGPQAPGRFLGERSASLATSPAESLMPPVAVQVESSTSNVSIPLAAESYMPPIVGGTPSGTAAQIPFVHPVQSCRTGTSSRTPTPTPRSLPRSCSSRAKPCAVEVVRPSASVAWHTQRSDTHGDVETRGIPVCARLKATPEPAGARSVSVGPASLEDRGQEQAAPMGPRSLSVSPRQHTATLSAPMVTLPQGWQTPSIGGAPGAEEPRCDEARPQQGRPSPRDGALLAGSVQRMNSGEPVSFHSAVFRHNAASPRSPSSTLIDPGSTRPSPNSEIARLYQDLARERSERQALAQRVETLAFTRVTDAISKWSLGDGLQQQAVPMPNDQSAVAALSISPRGISAQVLAKEDDAARGLNILAASDSKNVQCCQDIEEDLDMCISTREQDIPPAIDTAGQSSVAPSGDDQERTLMDTSLTSPIRKSSSPFGASPLVSTQASVSPWSAPTKDETSPDQPAQRPERRSLRGPKKPAARIPADGGNAPTHAVHEMMLADARAILAELEHDLVVPFKEQPSKVGVASRRAEKGESDDGEPCVLSFYRRKCLQLASQVHRRDTEVVRLRRALKEARTTGRTLASPSTPRSLDGTLQMAAATADDKVNAGESSLACGLKKDS